MLILSRDLNKLSAEKAENIKSQAEELSKIISGLKNSLN